MECSAAELLVFHDDLNNWKHVEIIRKNDIFALLNVMQPQFKCSFKK